MFFHTTPSPAIAREGKKERARVEKKIKMIKKGGKKGKKNFKSSQFFQLFFHCITFKKEKKSPNSPPKVSKMLIFVVLFFTWKNQNLFFSKAQRELNLLLQQL